MATALVELTDEEVQALDELARKMGKTPSDLLREAVTHLLVQEHSSQRLGLLRQARGMWKDRTDLPDVRVLRSELERSASQ